MCRALPPNNVIFFFLSLSLQREMTKLRALWSHGPRCGDKITACGGGGILARPSASQSTGCKLPVS
jgi:hypothetical protein